MLYTGVHLRGGGEGGPSPPLEELLPPPRIQVSYFFTFLLCEMIKGIQHVHVHVL